jgi:hypothetical protein
MARIRRVALALGPLGRCSRCGASLYSDGTCPNCDWPRR